MLQAKNRTPEQQVALLRRKDEEIQQLKEEVQKWKSQHSASAIKIEQLESELIESQRKVEESQRKVEESQRKVEESQRIIEELLDREKDAMGDLSLYKNIFVFVQSLHAKTKEFYGDPSFEGESPLEKLVREYQNIFGEEIAPQEVAIQIKSHGSSRTPSGLQSPVSERTLIQSSDSEKRDDSLPFSEFRRDRNMTKKLRSELPIFVWDIGLVKMEATILAFLFEGNTEAMKTFVDDQARIVATYRKIIILLKEETQCNVDEVHINQPAFYGFLVDMRVKLQKISANARRGTFRNVNGDLLTAWMPNDKGDANQFRGYGDIMDFEDAQADCLELVAFLAEMKKPFENLSAQYIYQTFLQFYALLNLKLGKVKGESLIEKKKQNEHAGTTIAAVEGCSSDVTTAAAPVVAAASGLAADQLSNQQTPAAGNIQNEPSSAEVNPQSVNDYFGWTADQSASVVGLCSNFFEIVLGYGDYRNGKYEFGFTPLSTATTTGVLKVMKPRDFVVHVLFLLCKDPRSLLEETIPSLGNAIGILNTDGPSAGSANNPDRIADRRSWDAADSSKRKFNSGSSNQSRNESARKRSLFCDYEHNYDNPSDGYYSDEVDEDDHLEFSEDYIKWRLEEYQKELKIDNAVSAI